MLATNGAGPDLVLLLLKAMPLTAQHPVQFSSPHSAVRSNAIPFFFARHCADSMGLAHG